MNTAIVLAGGSGRRMNSDIPKQYMMLKGKPVIYYSLKAFQDNLHIDDIILVTSDHYIEYVKKNILDDNIRIRIFMAMNLGQTMMEIFNEKILIEEKKSYYTQSEKKELTEEIKNGKIQAIYLYLFQKNMESNPKLNFLEAFEKIETDYIKKYNLK